MEQVMKLVVSFVGFILSTALTTVFQLLELLGVLFLLAAVLFFLEKWTTNCFFRTVGWKGVLFTGWFGTPIHELGHAFFCIPFFHKIKEIKLYAPDEETGVLGYVRHSYNPKNIYQRIGNFFIGSGPLVTGTIVLYSLLFLLPNGEEVFNEVQRHADAFAEFSGFMVNICIIGFTALSTIEVIFTPENFQSIQFWVFLYLSMCVASHIAPSPVDMKGVMSGLVTIACVLFIVNVAAFSAGNDITKPLLSLNQYTGVMGALLVYSITISLLNFILSYVILLFFSILTRGRLFLPF